MFAKFSPDRSKVAYVSEYNLYVDDLVSNNQKQLTQDGNRKFINGTFDWVYEEEFFCRDGFRWSPDSRQIAYWQIDARKTKDYLMIDISDSIYPFVKPVEYPIAGEPPSPFRIGVVSLNNAQTKWMNIPTDPVLGSYVPRMEWARDNNELIVQHLNRKQNASELMLCSATSGEVKTISGTDDAWIDILPSGTGMFGEDGIGE
jgi:dipeptidyl-peptidase-4